MSRPLKFRVSAGVFTLLLVGSACLGQENLLGTGDVAPDFECIDEHGGNWNSRKSMSGRMVVIFFYPSDFSFCCTRQARRYEDAYCEFVQRGVEVIGISGDSVEAHRMFKAAHGLNFTLLSDMDGNVARKFGVPLRRGGKAMVHDSNGKPITEDGKPAAIPRNFTTARWTFVVGKDGRVVQCNTSVSAIRDAAEVLELIDGLQASQ